MPAHRQTAGQAHKGKNKGSFGSSPRSSRDSSSFWRPRWLGVGGMARGSRAVVERVGGACGLPASLLQKGRPCVIPHRTANSPIECGSAPRSWVVKGVLETGGRWCCKAVWDGCGSHEPLVPPIGRSLPPVRPQLTGLCVSHAPGASRMQKCLWDALAVLGSVPESPSVRQPSSHAQSRRQAGTLISSHLTSRLAHNPPRHNSLQMCLSPPRHRTTASTANSPRCGAVQRPPAACWPGPSHLF